jgi:hypothetical protein
MAAPLQDLFATLGIVTTTRGKPLAADLILLEAARPPR